MHFPLRSKVAGGLGRSRVSSGFTDCFLSTLSSFVPFCLSTLSSSWVLCLPVILLAWLCA
jgi:hypothetical protein